MKHKMAGWIIGGLITASTVGMAFGVNSIGNAAEKTEQAAASSGMMMQNVLFGTAAIAFFPLPDGG